MTRVMVLVFLLKSAAGLQMAHKSCHKSGSEIGPHKGVETAVLKLTWLKKNVEITAVTELTAHPTELEP